jgi:ubiquinone/menaquinone biosynthesis C-methylase UbiE
VEQNARSDDVESRAHWEQVYQTKRSDEVSWYQADPATSLRLIERVAPGRAARIIDVGGGASLLVDRLVAAGYLDVTVLDISSTALGEVERRLPADALSRVTLLAGNVLTAPIDSGSIDVWHDRAVFHFLTDPSDRQAYVAQVRRAVRPHGHLIVATFAEDGPQKCSGLPVARYTAAQLHAEFGSRFALIDSVREGHVTPSGATQSFQYCVCRFNGPD